MNVVRPAGPDYRVVHRSVRHCGRRAPGYSVKHSMWVRPGAGDVLQQSKGATHLNPSPTNLCPTVASSRDALEAFWADNWTQENLKNRLGPAGMWRTGGRRLPVLGKARGGAVQSTVHPAVGTDCRPDYRLAVACGGQASLDRQWPGLAVAKTGM